MNLLYISSNLLLPVLLILEVFAWSTRPRVLLRFSVPSFLHKLGAPSFEGTKDAMTLVVLTLKAASGLAFAKRYSFSRSHSQPFAVVLFTT